MSTQRNELQFIPVKRNDYYTQKNNTGLQKNTRQHQRKILAEKKKRQRQKKLRLLFTTGVCTVLFFGLCYITNWFTEIPFLSQSAKLEHLKAQGDCPDDLLELLEKNEETYDFVKNYSEREKYIGKSIDLSKDCKEGNVPLLMQWDKRWGYDLYGDSMIALSGCGPTCMTMAYLYFTGDTAMNPRKMAEYAQESGYHSQEGTSWLFWTEGASKLGLYGTELSLDENVMKSVLDNNGLIVCSMSPGDFTDGGHYILVCGYDENGFFVNDPNRKSNSDKQWDFDTLQKQMKNLWSLEAH